MIIITLRANIQLIYILNTLLRLAIVKQHNISQDNVLNNIWLIFKVFIGNKFKDHFYKGYLANIYF
jgi:hypothetical protein